MGNRTRKYLLAIIPLLAVFIYSCEAINSPGVFRLITSATPEEGGTITPSDGEFEVNSEIEVEAEPAEGYRFAGWEGDLDGSENPTILLMDDDKQISAIFERKEYTLHVEIEGEGSVKEEIIERAQKDDYEHGTTVQLTAEPEDGWKFVRWEGDLEGSENVAVIEIEEEKNVTAVFEPSTFTLSIDIEGEGTVHEEAVEENSKAAPSETAKPTTQQEKGIDPGGSTKNPVSGMEATVESSNNNTQHGVVEAELKDGEYEDGTRVQLTAEAEEGWEFVRWEEDLDGNNNPETIEMDEDKNVTAVFREESAEADISISTNQVTDITTTSAVTGGNISAEGEATVTARGICWSTSPAPDTDDDCTNDGSGTGNYSSNITGLNPGTTYYIRAYAISNDEIRYGNEREFTTEDDSPDMFGINISTEGEGEVTLDPDQNEYESGSEVTLTAEPSGDWEFIRWEGDLDSEDNPATITMDEDKTITAVFEQEEDTGNGGDDGDDIDEMFIIDFSIDGEGEIQLDPDQQEYESGSEVTLTAEPASGWEFVRWEGDLESEENPATITVDEDKEITAVFEAIEFSMNVSVEGEGEVHIDPDQQEYESGSEVILTAEPASGWEFVRWEGDLEGEENPETIIMDEDVTITAVFESATVSHGYVEGVTPEDIDEEDAERTYPVIQADWDGPGGDKRWLGWDIGTTEELESLNYSNADRAGWYFQFNKSQGYRHDGDGDEKIENFPVSDVGVPRDPETDSDWIDDEPCTELLGENWRVPTRDEWNAVVDAGKSEELNLKLTGSVSYNLGALFGLGEGGSYWTSTQYAEAANAAYAIMINEDFDLVEQIIDMKTGMTIRCIED